MSIWLRKGNLKRETERTAQNNAIRINHIKRRIDRTQQKSKCRLYCERDETIDQVISEWSQIAQNEYKTRHERAGKVIHLELCEKSKFYHTNKWHLHKSESVLKNETHKPLRDCEIQTDHLISARRLDLIITNKKRQFAELWTLLSLMTTE